MGIHERDYARRDPPRGFGTGGAARSVRMWSVNTWIIVICVGVFVIDGFLPIRRTLLSTWVDQKVEKVDQKLRLRCFPPQMG